MKIVLAGGGTGGHFFPLIAVSERLRDIEKETTSKTPLELYYFADIPFDQNLLTSLSITFVKIPAGKMRIYFSFQNIVDFFKILASLPITFFKLLWIYPDVVFSKGGYIAFPVIFAARILGIPVMIHESDSVPGRSNKWAGSFADRIALSYPEAAEHFSRKEVIAVTGQPIRKTIELESRERKETSEDKLPTVFVVGGSLGAEKINTTVLMGITKFVERGHIVHQTGSRNFNAVFEASNALLLASPHKDRYTPLAFLDADKLLEVARSADIVITRAGSMLFEIAKWEIPALIIPISESNGDHQRSNAYAYAHAGAGVVIEEENLSDDILLEEIDRILGNSEIRDGMKRAARKFSSRDGAGIIAHELVTLALKHG